MSTLQVFNAVKFTRKGHVKVRLHVAKFSMEARKPDLKHSVSDSSRYESVEDVVEKMDRNFEKRDVLIGRSSFMRLGQIGGGNSWDPLMEGGRRELPELPIIEDETDIVRG